MGRDFLLLLKRMFIVRSDLASQKDLHIFTVTKRGGEITKDPSWIELNRHDVTV